jgi:phenylpropionate dioxygenase-like ring-hydroxylating dioxygenase large terminal subunit
LLLLLTPCCCSWSLSSQVHHGLLWVWPDADAALAAATPAAVIQELDQPGWSHRTQGWFARDLPLSMEAVVENVSGVVHGKAVGQAVLVSEVEEAARQVVCCIRMSCP